MSDGHSTTKKRASEPDISIFHVVPNGITR